MPLRQIEATPSNKKSSVCTIRRSVRNSKSAGETGADMITDLVNQIIVEGVIPAKWEFEVGKREKETLKKETTIRE